MNLVLVSGDDALKHDVEDYCANLGYAVSNEMPVERSPSTALVADLGMLAPLAAGVANQDLARHFGQVVALGDAGGFYARLQAARLGASAFLVRPFAAADIFDVLEDGLSLSNGVPIKVLIVDDDPIAARVIGRQMELAGIRVKTVEDPAQALDSIDSFQPDLAIIDLYMPQCTGTELAQVIRQISTFDSLPIIFLSSEAELAAQMTAVSICGDDFVAKGTPAALMIPLIRSRAERMRRLHRHLSTDFMTGLVTHTTFKQAIEAQVVAGGEFCLAVFDLDHLRAINGDHGHPVGDCVIKTLARLLRCRTRPEDLAGRVGGEEFGLLLPGLSLDQAAELVAQVRSRFASMWHRGADGRFQATCSAGLVGCQPGEGAEAVIARVVAALTQAKGEGRNRLVISR